MSGRHATFAQSAHHHRGERGAAAASAGKEAADDSINTVQIEGLVLMKIIKHCKESFPDVVTGQLLGLDVKRTLEVTNCFPVPRPATSGEEEEETEDDGVLYQMDMMKCLRLVNVDVNSVGWYHSTYMGSFVNEEFIKQLFNFQSSIKKSVVLIYDPLRTRQGKLSLRALRLTDDFMQLLKTVNFSQDSLTRLGLSFDNIFEELPIRIHNSLLSEALLYDLEQGQHTLKCDFDRFDLSLNPFLEKNMELIIEELDNLGLEQTRFQQYQRAYNRQQQKRHSDADGPTPEDPHHKQIAEPSRLESLLITSQINSYCSQINQFSGHGIGKLFLLGSLHKPV
eukprot:gnl/Spiro4/13346_TR7102_c0_g1_i1.p1 gnl/Spiro4/13346_TR7102_c0_g1~~gnl/Spiro4/13346_TR7102_c0_g1_i1.p1  ORF type:complete len:348 (+),score=105.41 gnl/Spiro4/13346_TR7102_c0_g1_i1:32-1045(+)